MKQKNDSAYRGIILILLALASVWFGYDTVHDSRSAQLSANLAVPLFLLISIALLTVGYAIIKNRHSLRKLLSGLKLFNDSTSDIKIEELLSIKKKLDKREYADSGIGTGVVKIFQHIKDNIGNLDTLTLGYRHLLDLSCEHLGFNAGAVFLISDQQNMSLFGYSGLKPEPQTSYTVNLTGNMHELMKSDFPRFVTDLSRIPGKYHGLFDGYKSAWLLPLVPQGNPVGIIVFLHNDIPEHREDYFSKLDFVGLAVSWFYENHSSQVLAEKENKRSRMLVKTSLAISMSLDLDKVCTILVEHLGNYYGCSFSYIMLSDDNDDSMRVRQVFSIRADKVFGDEEKQLNIEKISWIQDIIYMGNPVLLEKDEIASIPKKDRELLKFEGATRVMISPLKHGGKFEGLLVMVEQRSTERASMDSEVVNLTAAIVAQASAAIENARMYTQLSDRVAHMAVLTDVGQALNTDLDLIPFLERVLLTIARNLNLPHCTFLLLDENSNELFVAAIAGEYSQESLGRRFRVGEGIIGTALYYRKPININDTTKDERFIPTSGIMGSELAVPIMLNDKAVGVLDIESSSTYAFSPKDVNLLVSIVDQVAAAIEKLKLKQQEKERSNKLAITNHIVKKLSGILDRNDLLGEAVKSVREGFRFDLVAVFIADKMNGLDLAQQSCQYGYGYEPGTHLEVKESLIMQAYRDQENKSSDSISESDPVTGIDRINTHYCIPLMGIKNVHGVLVVQDTRSLAVTSIDKSTLQTIADFLALTLDNISLYQDKTDKAERLTLVDRINQAITSTLDLEELFTRVIQSLAQSTGYHWVTLVFKVQDKYKTNLDYFSNFNPEGWGEKQINGLSKYFDEVLVHNKPVYYNINRMELSNNLSEYFSIQRVNYLVVVPVIENEGSICLLLVGNPSQDGFRTQDQYLLADISQHLKIAMKNAILYSDLKKAYNDLSMAQEKIIQNEKFKALGEIAAGIAHDFKNIMAAIIGRVQMLSIASAPDGGISPDVLKRGLGIIEKSADDGVKILSRINEFTKTKNVPNFDRIDLRVIINDTIELTRAKWDNTISDNHISIKTNLEDDLIIDGDRPMMVEVFSNLINNAIDAIDGTGEIRIKAYIEKNNVRIDLADNGSGIPEDILSKIFDPFFTTKQRLGTGLGLAMVYSIIEGHSGSITVESESGRGTEFKITLPIANEAVVSESFSILIVEDDVNLRNVLKEYFIELNADVMLAENYETAMMILNEHNFDIIFTDLGLPDKDGWGVIDSVKASSPDSYLIPMTGWNREIQSSEMLSRGITDILKKPFSLDDVYKIVQKFEYKRKSSANSIA